MLTIKVKSRVYPADNANEKYGLSLNLSHYLSVKTSRILSKNDSAGSISVKNFKNALPTDSSSLICRCEYSVQLQVEFLVWPVGNYGNYGMDQFTEPVYENITCRVSYTLTTFCEDKIFQPTNHYTQRIRDKGLNLSMLRKNVVHKRTTFCS